MDRAIQLISACSDIAYPAATVYAAIRFARSWIRPSTRSTPTTVHHRPVDRERGNRVIEIIGRSGEPEAMNCPALICDGCRKQVTDSGVIVWGVTAGVEPRLSTPLYVAHKGRCDQAVQKGVETEYPEDTWVWLSEEADKFLSDLAGNFKRRFEDDKRGTFHEHRIALIERPATR